MGSDGWRSLGDRYYQKQELVAEMEWPEVDLSMYMVAGAKFGGPVALKRDKSKPVPIGKDAPPDDKIFIYTSGGRKICDFVPDGEHLVKMGWTDTEKLVCVHADGTVFAYNVHGDYEFQFSTGRTVKEQGVRDCSIWGTGLVILTLSNNLFWVNDFADPSTKPLPDCGLDEPPTCMTVIEPSLSETGQPEVLLGNVEASVIVLTPEGGCDDKMMTAGPFQKMECSADGKYVACWSESGTLYVYTADFQETIMEFDVKTSKTPAQLVWCGVDSIVLAYSNMLFMDGEWQNYQIDESFTLVAEIDGVRIVTNTVCEFLQRVPDCLVDVFLAGSCEPAAMLYVAYQELFEKHSAKADELIRNISDDLVKAVNTCIEAATYETEPANQKKLLKAAGYGKCFCEFYDNQYYQETCRTLRILNAIRAPAIGILITCEEYQRISGRVVVDRLIFRRHYNLASRICDYLDDDQIGTHRVAVHWACNKVRSEDTTQDAQLCDAIVYKLESCPGGSFVDVGRAAHEAGRKQLAVMLLDHEPCATDQVPLLLMWEEDEQALRKALQSGDTNLAHMALLHLQEQASEKAGGKRGLTDFFRLIKDKPAAQALYAMRARGGGCRTYSEDGGGVRPAEDPFEALKKFYFGVGRSAEAAAIDLIAAYQEDSLAKRLRSLEQTMDYLQQDKSAAFTAKAIEDQIKLLSIQRELELNCDGKIKYIDMPLADTIASCITNGEEKKARKLKDAFSVTERRYAWIKLKAFASARNWGEIDKMAKEKKSPIGYEPFVKVCFEQGEKQEAIRHVPKLGADRASAGLRVEWYNRLQKFEESVQIAVQLKDRQMLEEIESEVPRAMNTTKLQAVFNEAKQALR